MDTVEEIKALDPQVHRRLVSLRRRELVFGLWKSGSSQAEIARQINVTRQRVQQMLALMPGYVAHRGRPSKDGNAHTASEVSADGKE